MLGLKNKVKRNSSTIFLNIVTVRLRQYFFFHKNQIKNEFGEFGHENFIWVSK